GASVIERSVGSVTAEYAMGLLGGGHEPDDVLQSSPQVRQPGNTTSTSPQTTQNTQIGFLGEPRLLKRIGTVDPTSLDAYLNSQGYDALEKAFELGPEGIIRELTDAKLLGRG